MSKEQLLVDQETPDLQVETPDTIQRHYSEINPSQFDKRTRLTGFGETQVPLQVAISSRYCCVLFDPDNGFQKYNIYQRYTNARLYQGEAGVVIRDFFIYDPMDCGIKSDYCNGEAYLILVLNKAAEYSEYNFQVIRISQTNQFKSMTIGVTRGRWQHVRFASVACDLSYFAIAFQDEGGSGETRWKAKVKFLKIKNEKLEEVSSSEEILVKYPVDLFCKATFVGKTGKALVLTQEVDISLVQVSSGKTLSKIEIKGYEGLELGYYFDINQYFYISKLEGKEWKLVINSDSIELQETNPIIHYDISDPPNFSYTAVPYQYLSHEMPSIYSNSNMSSFSVDQKSFELTLNDIKYSRSIILPNLKVFYTISAQEPYDITVIEMNNLDIQFLTTFSTNQLTFSTDNSKGFTQLIVHDNNLKKSDVTQGISILQKLSSYLSDKIKYEKFSIQQIKDFQVSAGKFMSIKLNNQYRVFDLEKNKCVGKYIGLKLIFSENGLAFVVHICGNNFSYWSWDPIAEEFTNTLPLIKNVASRVDFLPGSHTQLVIYDEFYHSIILRDTVENSVEVKLKNVSFSSDEYKLVTENLILYSEQKIVGQQKVQVSILYNLNLQFEEIEFSGKDTITDIKVSKDKSFLYVATNMGISVYESSNLSNKICSYSIGNVHHIIENDDQTYLIIKLENSFQIFGVKTLNPKEKYTTVSSGSLIMKYIVTALHNEENMLKQHSVKAYVQFQKQGMIDSFFEPNGETFLHYLIREHPSDLLKAYLTFSESNLVYNNSFEGNESPLTLAYKLKKMQHLNMILEHFNEYPELIEVNSEDVLTLMECGLNSAAALVPQLFQKPYFHKCALPYSTLSDKDIILVEQPSVNIGLPMVSQVQTLMHDKSSKEEKVYEYSITRFSYNFARGSKSSIDFLNMYANQDSEEILRSDLRFIILKKFEECKFFLILQAGLFFTMLFLVFLKLIYFPESWLFLILVFALNTLFLGYEINQLVRSGFADYFDSLWNYIDIIGFILLYVVNIAYYANKNIDQDETYGGLISLITVISILSLLLRGMSHLRIFSNLRYLINMIVEIMSDMSSFTIILAYWIVGLNVAFFMLSHAKQSQQEVPGEADAEPDTTGEFLENLKMTYRLAFGDFSPDEYAPLEWFLFVLGSCFIPLVLFNLIIAIMGDTYDRVQTSAKCVDLKEQANLVLEAEELLYWRRNAGNDKIQKTLICYNEDLGEGVASEGAEWEGKIKGLTKQMNRIETKLTDVSKMKDEIIRVIKAQSRK